MSYTLLIGVISEGNYTGLVYPTNNLPSYDGAVRYKIPTEQEKYIPFLNGKDPTQIGKYINKNHELDSTSENFINDYKRSFISEIIKMRDKKLSETDWTQMSDNGMDDETRQSWRVYRQELRDLPQLIEYDENYKPLPFDWPTPPQ